MVIAYVSFPPNPDRITVPMVRVARAFTVGLFWLLMGITLGSFWDKLKPYNTTKT